MKNIFVLICTAFLAVIFVTACKGEETPAPSTGVTVTDIKESELVTGQITQVKTFDQCNSSSVFRTEIQFSDSNIQTSQQGLVLGAEVSGGGKVPGAVELEIKGSIEKHFSETTQQGQSHGGSVSIEVPAYTKQEYTIVWQETRREGTVEYEENGQKNSTSYSYRTGIELAYSSSKDIDCPNENTPDPTSSLPAPQTNEFSLNFRKAHPTEVANGLVSIWKENNISVDDMLKPGTASYSGSAGTGMEYIFPVYWCATNESILADNRDVIKTSFFLDGKQIPEEYVLVYGYNSEKWRCVNTSVMLSGWASGEEYDLQIIRNFEASVFDGKTTYPSGKYIYALHISVP